MLLPGVRLSVTPLYLSKRLNESSGFFGKDVTLGVSYIVF